MGGPPIETRTPAPGAAAAVRQATWGGLAKAFGLYVAGGLANVVTSEVGRAGLDRMMGPSAGVIWVIAVQVVVAALGLAIWRRRRSVPDAVSGALFVIPLRLLGLTTIDDVEVSAPTIIWIGLGLAVLAFGGSLVVGWAVERNLRGGDGADRPIG